MAIALWRQASGDELQHVDRIQIAHAAVMALWATVAPRSVAWPTGKIAREDVQIGSGRD